MKTRKGSSRAEKPSNDEEDASSDESVKVTSKKSAKKSAKRKNVKLPLMELTKNDSAPRLLSKCQAGEDIVPDALSRTWETQADWPGLGCYAHKAREIR